MKYKNYRFILTGSSARSLRKKGVNLLAGRAVNYYMHPLIAQELGADFNLEHSLQFGLLPATLQEPNIHRYLSAYVHNYIREEVQQEGLTRNIGDFTRFLETISLSQGNLMNTTAIGRDASVSRKVVENYITILEDLLLGYRLYPFTRKPSTADFKGLKAFKEDYPIAKLFLIYGGSHREYHGDVEVIPITEALQQLPELLKKS